MATRDDLERRVEELERKLKEAEAAAALAKAELDEIRKATARHLRTRWELGER